MQSKCVVVIVATGLLLAGCANSGPKETGGAVIGGVAGGLLGNTIGGGKGRAAATILGAALGAVVGGAVGRNLDDADRERAYYAADRSFRTGREASWENPNNGHRGRIKPRRSYRDDDDRMCRDFEHTIWVEGEPELIEGTACEMRDGSWRVVG
ncbi:glycine zipper 2TM domain-containing protein [Nordella sp. HKS 07]|uniref:RT0821/Lpp0805 family surface protein n=1 Tax=Nordella sp. HKS 07 TaxID=2712222 RepID=UPI0013E1C6B6|nr:RT0821/Lpp0805 family surface protein [Nordella sp. HKS 07]QIG47995.1 glycine zipper 2TM domain-containing protein [Nordella sp. HKS 07]